MKTTFFILSFVFTLMTMTTEAKPNNGRYYRHHRPVVVFTPPTPSVYYRPVPPPVCQHAPPPPVVVYRPAPYYRGNYHRSGHCNGGYQSRGNCNRHR